MLLPLLHASIVRLVSGLVVASTVALLTALVTLSAILPAIGTFILSLSLSTLLRVALLIWWIALLSLLPAVLTALISVLLAARLAGSLLCGRQAAALFLVILIGLIALIGIVLAGILLLNFRRLTSPRIIRIAEFAFFLHRFSSHGKSPLSVNLFPLLGSQSLSWRPARRENLCTSCL